MNSFFTGQVVVCINKRDGGYWKSHKPDGSIILVPGPKLDDTCLIRGIDCTGYGLLLDRYKSAIFYIDGTEAGYHYSGFRPLVQYKNDISVLKALLVPAVPAEQGLAHRLPAPHTSRP